MQSVVFKCTCEGKTAEIKISFGAVSNRLVLSKVSLLVAGFNCQVPCYFTGYKLLTFRDQFIQMYNSLSGEAQLMNFEESVTLCLAASKKVPGQIVIGGKLANSYVGDLDAYTFKAGEFEPGIEVIFGGLRTDQSYLPEPLDCLKAFLVESAIDTSSPWGTG